MTRAIIAGIVYGVLLGAPLTARATINPWAHPQCLADHPAAAEDAAALAAVRAQIDARCPCDHFTPTTKKNIHGAYVACAGIVVIEALWDRQLRSACLDEALYPAVHATCGYPLDPPRSPCVHTSAPGVVGCTITTADKCDGAREVFCTEYTNCLDAADTNQDGKVGRGDSGACNPLQDCADQQAQGLVRRNDAQQQCIAACVGVGECTFGCIIGGGELGGFIDAEFTVCQANPTGSCETLRDINLAYCASQPSEPQQCFNECNSVGDVCLQNCVGVADCDREAEAAYAYCVQTQQ